MYLFELWFSLDIYPEVGLLEDMLVLSIQEAFISLLSFSFRGQTDWKPQSQKTNQSDHMDHSLV